MSRKFLEEIRKNQDRRRDERRREAIQEADFRRESLYRQVPRLHEITDALSVLSRNLAKSRIFKLPLDDMESQLAELLAEKRSIWESLGLQNNYLEVHWHCPICQDTGVTPHTQNEDGRVTPGKQCQCQVREDLADIYRYCNIPMLDPTVRFESFKFSVYPVEHRAHMKAVASQAWEYAQRVIEDHHAAGNMVLAGEVGRGKTFLASAIANHVIEQGHTAIYLTIEEYIQASKRTQINNDKASTADDALMDMVRNARFVLQDDLGAETVSAFVIKELYRILDHRMLSRLPTIFTTNLSPRDIEEKYGDRVASRLFSAQWLYLRGNDLRMQLKAGQDHGNP